MQSSTVSSPPRIHKVIHHQERYRLPRRFIRDILLRGIGFRLLVRVNVEGVEHIPPSGPTLLVMNHIAAIDPFVVCGVVGPRFVVPMTKVENYYHPLIGLMARAWGAFPVRRGEVDRQALTSAIELLSRGIPVLIAPEGTRQPALAEPKDGMTYLALKAGAALVPVGLDGTDQFPSTLRHLRRTPVTIRFGRPFMFQAEQQARVPRETMHQMTQEAMYQIAALLPEHRRGSYRDLSRATTGFLRFLD